MILIVRPNATNQRLEIRFQPVEEGESEDLRNARLSAHSDTANPLSIHCRILDDLYDQGYRPRGATRRGNAIEARLEKHARTCRIYGE